MAFRIREATIQDLDAVVALRVALLREHPTHPIYGRLRPDVEQRARQFFGTQLRSTQETMLLAEMSDAIVGILRCVESVSSPLLEPARYAYISSTYVHPTVRRRGVLRSLLGAADRWARRRGLTEMRLHNVAGSTDAEGAWDALGFEIVEQVRFRRVPPASG